MGLLFAGSDVDNLNKSVSFSVSYCEVIAVAVG